MRTEFINGHTLVLYSSIDELPMSHYHRYNKYLLIDAGIGPEVSDIDDRLANLAKLIRTDDKKAAADALANIRMSLAMAQNEISPKSMALIALCHSYDGNIITDYSDENIKCILQDLHTIKYSALINLLNQVKKKIEQELYEYFPQYFDSAKEKDIAAKVVRLIKAKLAFIESGKDTRKEVERLEAELNEPYKPLQFTGKKSAEIEYDKHFEAVCLLISQEARQNPRVMNVLQFYSTLAHVESQLKMKHKAYKKHR